MINLAKRAQYLLRCVDRHTDGGLYEPFLLGANICNIAYLLTHVGLIQIYKILKHIKTNCINQPETIILDWFPPSDENSKSKLLFALTDMICKCGLRTCTSSRRFIRLLRNPPSPSSWEDGTPWGGGPPSQPPSPPGDLARCKSKFWWLWLWRGRVWFWHLWWRRRERGTRVWLWRGRHRWQRCYKWKREPSPEWSKTLGGFSNLQQRGMWDWADMGCTTGGLSCGLPAWIQKIGR